MLVPAALKRGGDFPDGYVLTKLDLPAVPAAGMPVVKHITRADGVVVQAIAYPD